MSKIKDAIIEKEETGLDRISPRTMREFIIDHKFHKNEYLNGCNECHEEALAIAKANELSTEEEAELTTDKRREEAEQRDRGIMEDLINNK